MTFPGSTAIVAAAESQVQEDPVAGRYCNPYGPCEEWCALFATWAIEQGGIPIPSYPFTGSIFTWGEQHGSVLAPTATPVPGDDVLYGTGPATTASSVHTGIVAQVWPDGAIITIEGDAGPGTGGDNAVIVNGPFRPVDSWWSTRPRSTPSSSRSRRGGRALAPVRVKARGGGQVALYDYRCSTCGVVYEHRRAMADADAPSECPAGHVGAVRLLPVFATVSSSSEAAAMCGAPTAGGCGGGCACHPG